MNLTDQIYAQALVMVGSLTAEQDALLRVLCQAAKATLAGRLRSNITPEDCRADFISAGEMTIQRGDRSGAAGCLRSQAEGIMAPYAFGGSVFLGV